MPDRRINGSGRMSTTLNSTTLTALRDALGEDAVRAGAEIGEHSMTDRLRA